MIETKEAAIELIKENATNISKLSLEFRKDEDIAFEAIIRNEDLIKYIHISLINNKTFIKRMLNTNGVNQGELVKHLEKRMIEDIYFGKDYE